MKKLITILAGIVLILGISFTALGAVNTHKPSAGQAITDVDCTCGNCSLKAIRCLCITAREDLKKAGFTMEDIGKYIKSKTSA